MCNMKVEKFCKLQNDKADISCFPPSIVISSPGQEVDNSKIGLLSNVTHELRKKLSARGASSSTEPFSNSATILNTICINDDYKCDYQNHCLTGYDENENVCTKSSSPGESNYHSNGVMLNEHCQNKTQRVCLSTFDKCIDNDKFCDGNLDCPDGSDELFCYRCLNVDKWFLPEQLCDGVDDCGFKDEHFNGKSYDEAFCNDADMNNSNSESNIKENLCSDSTKNCGLGVVCDNSSNSCTNQCKISSKSLNSAVEFTSNNANNKCQLKSNTLELLTHEDDKIYKISYDRNGQLNNKFSILKTTSSEEFKKITDLHINPKTDNVLYQIQYFKANAKASKETEYKLISNTLEHIEELDKSESFRKSSLYIGDYDIDTKTGNIYFHERLSSYLRPYVLVLGRIMRGGDKLRYRAGWGKLFWKIFEKMNFWPENYFFDQNTNFRSKKSSPTCHKPAESSPKVSQS